MRPWRAAAHVLQGEGTMLHEQRGDPELERLINAICKQLASAKVRVRALYPRGRICWVLEVREWVVIDAETRERLEASQSLDELATGDRTPLRKAASGTYRRTDND
jgi:hypothetical protein